MDAALLGDGVADLPFQVKLLLPTHLQRVLQAPWCTGNGGLRTSGIGGACQVHGRDDVLAFGMGVLRRQHWRQAVDAEHVLGACGHTAGLVAGLGDDGKHRLAQVTDLSVAQDRVVMDDGAAVVGPGNVSRRQHRDHAGQGPQCVQRHGSQPPARHGRQAQRAVQRARQLRDVVDVGGLTRHMQVGRLMGAADAHACATVLGTRLGGQVDTRRRVLLVVGEGLRGVQQAGVDTLVHVRLLALRRGASRSIRWWPRGAMRHRCGSPATDAAAGSAPPAGGSPPMHACPTGE